MALRVPDNLTRRINSFVPALSYASDVIENAPCRFILGTPVVGAAQAILAAQDIAAASNTTTLLLNDLLASCRYGRNLTVRKPSGAATGTVTVTGRDYLGQPMKEQFTTVASTSTIVQGKKAFKYIDQVDWTAHAGSTLDLGTGNKLGLPYCMDNGLYGYENAVKMERSKDVVWVKTTQAALNAAAVNTVRSPVKGNVVAIRSVVSTVIGAGNAAITVDVNGGTAITGLALTVVATSAVGVQIQKSVANLTANCAVLAGDTINLTNDAVTASGAVETEVGIQPDAGLFTDAILTDPQTLTTGDPRGLYEAFNTLDGVKQIEVVMTASRFVNASGRGGLHGMAHFFS